MVLVIIHDIERMLISCLHQHFITCTNVKIHSFNVPFHFKFFLCQFLFLEFILLCYEQHKRFNIHRHSPSALWYVSAIRRPGKTPVNNREFITAPLYLPDDQIPTFYWMWNLTWLFKRETVCGVEIIRCAMWFAEALCILCLRFNVHSSLAQGYCFNVSCI